MEIVKEFPTRDGLGAMLWKKIYAMSYAYSRRKVFEDTPFEWFIIHESDRVNNQEEMNSLMYKFNNLLSNPWDHINFDDIQDKTICTEVGLGAPEPGFADCSPEFLFEAVNFNKFDEEPLNAIVIHLRRGNAIPENPRYMPDEFYFKVLSGIPKLIQDLKLNNPRIIICTDAPDVPKKYKPVSHDQQIMWGQPHLYADENGEYDLTTANFDEFRKICPGLEIINTFDPYDSFLLMLNAKVLIVGQSAFSQSAGLLSKNKVIGMVPKFGMSYLFNIFKNKIGNLNENGEIILDDNFRN